MPKRKIDPTTGEPQLTYREQMLVDEFFRNGGNGSQAAASAGYGAARPDQSAYQVLRRPEVQRRIQQRIAESRVSADEIIGTLASFMRGTLADFLDESGEFNMEVAIQRGVDHRLKSVTTTTREIQATKDKPAQVVRTCRPQLHSPVQAATVLARIFGIDRNSLSARDRSRSVPAPAAGETPEALARDNFQRDFNPLVWLDDLITDQMRQTGQSRSAVIDSLIQLRPEIAKYVKDLEQSRAPKPFDDLSLRDTARQLAKTIDLLVSLANTSSAEPEDNASLDDHLFGVPPSGEFCPEPQSEEPQQSSVPPANQQPPTSNLQPGSISTHDSRPKTTDSQESHPLPMFGRGPALTEQEVPKREQGARKLTDLIPTQNSRLKTRHSENSQLLSMFPPGPALQSVSSPKFRQPPSPPCPSHSRLQARGSKLRKFSAFINVLSGSSPATSKQPTASTTAAAPRPSDSRLTTQDSRLQTPGPLRGPPSL